MYFLPEDVIVSNILAIKHGASGGLTKYSSLFSCILPMSCLCTETHMPVYKGFCFKTFCSL